MAAAALVLGVGIRVGIGRIGGIGGVVDILVVVAVIVFFALKWRYDFGCNLSPTVPCQVVAIEPIEVADPGSLWIGLTKNETKLLRVRAALVFAKLQGRVQSSTPGRQGTNGNDAIDKMNLRQLLAIWQCPNHHLAAMARFYPKIAIRPYDFQCMCDHFSCLQSRS